MSLSFQDFEIILVDDGSKDDSSAICDALADTFSKVKTIHTENNGFAAKYPSLLPKSLFWKYNRHIDWNLLFSRYCPFKEKLGYITKLLGIHGISRILKSNK